MANRHVVAYILSLCPCPVADLPESGPYSGKKIRAAIAEIVSSQRGQVLDGVLYEVVRKSIQPPAPPKVQVIKKTTEPKLLIATGPWTACTLNRLPLSPGIVHLLADGDAR